MRFMKDADPIVDRLRELVRLHRKELAGDILFRVGLGLVFSLLTFGFIFWVAVVFGWFVAYQIGVSVWTFAWAVTAVFFVVAVFSAFARVNPLAGVGRLTEKQRMHLLVAQSLQLGMMATGLGGFRAFDARQASAGFATVLIGGPLNFVLALSAWSSRLRANAATIASAARLLDASRKNLPIEKVKDVDAAVLLRRLALIKFVPLELSHQVALTEKAEKLLRAADKSAGKKSKVRDS
jgi:hypothetical protein